MPGFSRIRLTHIRMFFAIGLVAGSGAWGFSHVKSRGVQLNPASLWALGFGSVNQDALAIYGYDASTITMAIMANIPQVFLALIYLIYTGIMTTMFIAVDWSHLGTKGNTLIVRSPVGNQRGPWALGAPLGYGACLVILSIFLHWLVSQSFFLVQMSVYDKGGAPYSEVSTFANCGFSPIAIIF